MYKDSEYKANGVQEIQRKTNNTIIKGCEDLLENSTIWNWQFNLINLHLLMQPPRPFSDLFQVKKKKAHNVRTSKTKTLSV